MNRYTDYNAFAWIYNKYWGPDAVRLFLPVLEKLLLSSLPPRARILDLACGTGQLACAIARRGYRVAGLDSSEEMIRFARINAPDVEFFVDDARSFHLLETYHAVVSTYDSLNHLMSIEDLSQVFRNANACLRPGGWFLFDLNMEEGYKTRWRGSFGIVQDDHVCVVGTSFDKEQKTGQTAITILRLDKGVWHRSDVVLRQRCYPEIEIVSALETEGFVDVQTIDAHDVGWAREIGRMFFLSRKPGENDRGG